ncbi:MAG: glycosyltransferase family 2 protein [Clostridiales bacterium]|nr:glycosyltransferase family 2 protein [Clostridiales bacterium]
MSGLSILTPTYNRAENLNALFSSLCAQTSQDFEWWIVDDGSTDDTAKAVQLFTEQADFPIHYIYKENGGKHTALNVTIPRITSELTIIVDSDDLLTSDAVEIIYQYHNKYAAHPGLCGYTFLRKHPDGLVSGKLFTPDERIASYIDVRINGDDTHVDKAEVFYTRCLQEFPFSEFPGEKFLGEDAVWLQMGRKYAMVHINQAIYVFEYREDGLTRNRRRHNIASPRGCMYRAALYMEKDIKLRYRIKAMLQYLIYGRFAGESMGALLRTVKCKLWPILLVIPAQLIYVVWSHKY